jgi:hypothetical protein
LLALPVQKVLQAEALRQQVRPGTQFTCFTSTKVPNTDT